MTSDPKKIINDTLKELKKDRTIFHSESDFQHCLAMKLSQQHKEITNIRLERSYFIQPEKNNIDDNEGKIKLDLEFCYKNKKYGIELKYKTKEFEYESQINCEEFKLKNHQAHNLAKYGFWHDVDRIYMLINKKKIYGGFVIFLTNDMHYLDKDDGNNNMSQKFSICNDREVNKDDKLNWYKNGKEIKEYFVNGKDELGESVPKKYKKTIQVKENFTLKWQDYSELSNSVNFKTVFKYLFIEIKNHH